MAKRLRSSLELIKGFVDRSYSSFGNLLLVDTNKKYDPEHSDLGFCFKYMDPSSGRTIYKIDCSRIGIEETDFRIMMHEYGHIYLGHLDGIHEELDRQLCTILENNRQDLIDQINNSCGIDFGEQLVNRVINDPWLNHSLHNIAMDMEVNSKILSKEDVEEMEADVTSILPKYEEELLKYMIDKAPNEEIKKQLEDDLKKMENEAKIKLILPCRYNLGVNSAGVLEPFPDELTYPDYLILIFEHLDQFVKMLVSIQMGGNGDTSQVSSQDIQNAMGGKEYWQGYNDAQRDVQSQMQQSQNGDGQQQQGQGQGQPNQGQGQPGGSSGQPGQQNQSDSGSGSGKSQEYQRGYQDGLRDAMGGGSSMQSLSDLMNQSGMSDPGQQGKSDQQGQGQNGEGKDSPYQGTRNLDAGKDHNTPDRDKADQERKLGHIHSGGGVGCGSGSGDNVTRAVDKTQDEVDMALDEVFRNLKNRVVKIDTKKDNMRLYNRGIVRSVIAPTVTRKTTISNNPKIVYLIDISGSMDTALVDRVLNTIGRHMKKLSRGLRYDIITWNTSLGEHIKDVDPRKGIPRIHMGGGTSLARGIQYFKDNYDSSASLVVISDFEDYLEEWHNVEMTMNGYSLFGFNYGDDSYRDSDKIPWKNMKVRKFRQWH